MADAKSPGGKKAVKRGPLHISKETIRDLKQKGRDAEKVKGGKKVAIISLICG